MFERSVSFWRRLLGTASELSPTVPVATERRRSTRYRAEQEVQCHLTNPEGDEPAHFRAHLRNVSSGGISFVLDREVVPGALLNIDLPGGTGEESTTVLACVAHVGPAGDGHWLVGCTFASQLDQTDLDSFAPDAKLSGRDEQRHRTRHSCELQASYQLVAEEKEESYPAQVLNLSTMGVGLSVTQPIDAGKLLNVELHSPGGEEVRSLLCCAVHVTRQANSEWILGCNFIAELEESELRALLQPRH